MNRAELVDRFSDDELERRLCRECGVQEAPGMELVWCGSRLVCPVCAGLVLPCRTCGRPTDAKPPIGDVCVQPVEVVSESVRARYREMAA